MGAPLPNVPGSRKLNNRMWRPNLNSKMNPISKLFILLYLFVKAAFYCVMSLLINDVNKLVKIDHKLNKISDRIDFLCNH
jgi:hypothetical protein